LNGLKPSKDIRYTRPNEDHYRKARFKVGWRHAAEEQYIYGERALDKLTWQNLGNRLGAILGSKPEDLQEEMYELCVKLQAQLVSKHADKDDA
jgi:hypothetical protein